MKGEIKMTKEKDIYTLCNDIHTDLEQYDAEPINELDKKRMQYKGAEIAAAYPKQKQKRKSKNYKWIAAACSALLVCGVMMTDTGSRAVYAAGENVAYHISSFLGIDRNLSEYATVIGTEEIDNGYSIRLNEVILDQNTLIVATDVYKTDSEGNVIEEVPMGIPIGDVFINGRDAVRVAAGGAQYDEAGNALGAVVQYHLDERIDTSGELDIKLVYHSISAKEGHPTGNWEFHFIADGKALADATQYIPLNYVVTSDNDAKIMFSHYSSNILGARIYYSIEGKLNKNIYLNGVDDAGNEVQFISNIYEGNYEGTEGKGYMTPFSNGMITEDTKSLTLTPYVSSDIVKDNRHFRGELVQAGEPFVIELK